MSGRRRSARRTRADDALGRPDHHALRDLPPPPPHLRSGRLRARAVQADVGLPQRRDRVRHMVRVGLLYRGDDRARASHLPWRVERVSNARPEHREDRSCLPSAGDRVVAGGRARQRLGPRRRAHGCGQMTVGATSASLVDGRLDAKIPPGPIEQKWERHCFDMKLVSPANRRRYTVLVVVSGIAVSAAAASLGELGYKVECFSYHDSPRRAHSIAAQGGINPAKNYRNDGDSVFRLFYDTVKGGDFRAREANAYRLAQVSVNIIDQCVAQGVPFARDYGGLLETRSFGGVQVERTFYARGQTGQQLLLGAYQALERQVGLGTVTMHTRAEMLDLVVIDGQARGIIVRDLVHGAVSAHTGDAVARGSTSTSATPSRGSAAP